MPPVRRTPFIVICLVQILGSTWCWGQQRVPGKQPIPSHIPAVQECSAQSISAVFQDVTAVKNYPPSELPMVCTVIIDDRIRLTLYVYYAGENQVLTSDGLRKLHNALIEYTGAAPYPQPSFDAQHYWSLFRYFSTGQVVPEAFVSDDRKRGFLSYDISDTRRAYVVVESSASVSTPELISVVTLAAPRTWAIVIGLLTITLIPLLMVSVLVIPSKYRTKVWLTIDSIRAYGINIGVLVLLLWPTTVLLAFWLFGFQTPSFSVAGSITIACLCVIARQGYRRLSRRSLTKPKDGYPQCLMSSLIRISTWQVFSAPVKEDKEYLITLWSPYEQVCRHCNCQYVIYTPSRITQDARMGEPTETEALRQLEAAAQRACPPVNGCPRCHDAAHVSKEAREKYRKETGRQMRSALLLCLVGIVGAGLLYYVQTQQFVKAGAVLSIAKAIGSALPVSVNDMYVAGACLILASGYSAYRILLGRGSIGLWVCAGEGLILENLEQQSELEAMCPSCKSAMVPIWDVKL